MGAGMQLLSLAAALRPRRGAACRKGGGGAVTVFVAPPGAPAVAVEVRADAAVRDLRAAAAAAGLPAALHGELQYQGGALSRGDALLADSGVCSEATVQLVPVPKQIWVRTPGMDDGNEVKLDVPCDSDVGDIRSLAMPKLPFVVDVKEGQLEVLTLTGDLLSTRMLISDLTEEQLKDDTLIVRISQKRPVSPRAQFPCLDDDAPPPFAEAADSEDDRGSVHGHAPPDVASKAAPFVVHIDRVAPDLPDACLRKAVQDQLGPVDALEVIRSGVSEEARKEHFAFGYAFAFLPAAVLAERPWMASQQSPVEIKVSHRDVSGRVARLGRGGPPKWPEEQVRVRVTNRPRSMPQQQPAPRATLHVRVFARLSKAGGWSERLRSIKWPGFLALVEATREKGAPGESTPTDHIKIIADDKGTKSCTHPRVLLCGFFVECHSAAGARALKEAVSDTRVCCEGVAFLLQCDYTLKEKKLYDRCGRRDTYGTFYARWQQKYDEARLKARGAVEAARASGSLGQMLGEDFFTFDDGGAQQRRAPGGDGGAVAQMPPESPRATWAYAHGPLPGSTGPAPEASLVQMQEQIQALQAMQQQQLWALHQMQTQADGGAAAPPGVNPPPSAWWHPPR